MVFDNYIDNECKKREEILDAVRNGSSNINEARPRLEIAEARIKNLESMNVDSEFPVFKDHLYIAFYCKNIRNLLQVVNFVASSLESGSGGAMEPKILGVAITVVNGERGEILRSDAVYNSIAVFLFHKYLINAKNEMRAKLTGNAVKVMIRAFVAVKLPGSIFVCPVQCAHPCTFHCLNGIGQYHGPYLTGFFLQ